MNKIDLQSATFHANQALREENHNLKQEIRATHKAYTERCAELEQRVTFLYDSQLTLADILNVIIANAVIGPDASKNGSTDCYHVPLEDIDAARQIIAGRTRDITPEQQAMMQAARKRKVI